MTVTIVKGVTADDSVGAASITGTVAVANGGTGATTLTGILIGNGTGPVTATTTSSGIAGAISDETGSGALVFANTPTLISPLLGTPTSGVMTNVTGTAAGLTAGNATLAATATVATNLFNTTAVTVTDSTGRMTLPAQVYFEAYTAGHANVTGDGTDYVAIFELTKANVGTCYDTTTGVFTAPIAGKYLFTSTLHMTPLASSSGGAGYFYYNSSTTYISYIFVTNPVVIASGDAIAPAGAWIIKMAANDTMAVRVNLNNVTKTAGLGSRALFSGILLG